MVPLAPLSPASCSGGDEGGAMSEASPVFDISYDLLIFFRVALVRGVAFSFIGVVRSQNIMERSSRMMLISSLVSLATSGGSRLGSMW